MYFNGPESCSMDAENEAGLSGGFCFCGVLDKDAYVESVFIISPKIRCLSGLIDISPNSMLQITP